LFRFQALDFPIDCGLDGRWQFLELAQRRRLPLNSIRYFNIFLHEPHRLFMVDAPFGPSSLDFRRVGKVVEQVRESLRTPSWKESPQHAYRLHW
jgi:hypothetical protein